MAGKGEVELRKCGLKFKPMTLVVVYTDRRQAKTRKHSVPLRLEKDSDIPELAQKLRSDSKHSRVLQPMSEAQLERLLTIARDNLCGLTLKVSQRLSIFPQTPFHYILCMSYNFLVFIPTTCRYCVSH